MEGDGLPFKKFLYSAAHRLAGNRDTAEDLVQETCMKAFRYYGKFKKGASFRAWLCKILRNSFINHYRKAASESTRIRRMVILKDLNHYSYDEIASAE